MGIVFKGGVKAPQGSKFAVAPFDKVVGPPAIANANITLLLHSNATNGSTVFNNSAIGELVTATFGTLTTNVHHSTSEFKFGTSSIAFDGNDGLVIGPQQSANVDFGTSNFTIDFFAKTLSYVGANNTLFDIRTATSDTYIQLALSNNGGFTTFSNSLPFQVSTTSSTVGLWSHNVWHHLAFVRNGTDFKLYLDGTVAITYPGGAGAWPSINGLLYLGAYGVPSGIGGEFFGGWIDEFRVTKEALWTAPFTPPTTAGV